MAKMIGYMVTWTTYGTWLQGDKRGYVKNGAVLGSNARLKESNKKSQAEGAIVLNSEQRKTVREAIEKEAERIKQKIYALAVCSKHVHMVVNYIGGGIEKKVGRYKNSARVALNSCGYNGRIWTKGFNKRYCFDEKALKQMIDYVQRHESGKETPPRGRG